MTLLALLLTLITCQTVDWSGAQWIGAPQSELPLCADYLPVFTVGCDFKVGPGQKISVLYGANDPRLMNRNLNIYNLENQLDSSWIKVEIDGDGKIAVYRSGYHPADDPATPVTVFDVENLNTGANHLEIASNLGFTDISVNNRRVGHIGLNPVGNGGDYLAFPVLADMAVDVPSGSGAEIANVTVGNFRAPATILYRDSRKFTSPASIELPVRSMPELKSVIPVYPSRQIASASVTATARGIYDLKINGRRVTDDYFYPGSTQYNMTHLYHSFDITPLLTSGTNDISVQLGEGWWSGGSTFVGENWNFFGDRQSFIAVVKVSYTDGTCDTFVTSPDSWLCSTDGPVIEGSFFQGQIHDAGISPSSRRWLPAVQVPVDSTTVNLSVGSWDAVNLRPSFGDRVVAVDTLTAISVTEPRPGVFVYDMGQNMAGIPLLKFSRPRQGQEITVRYAEVLYPSMPQYAGHEGMIMTENLRAAMCRDIYRAAGLDTETFSPRFTLHGFRYIELTGIDRPMPLDAVKAVVLSSVHRFNAHYECSDTLVNRLWENIKWSTLSNFISIPTDCPQRNERLGWMGDISVYAPTATRIADVSAILAQYLTSVRDCQAPDGRFPDVAPTGFGFGGLLWGSAGITVAMEHFNQYGDTALLQQHYPAMKRYIDYILEKTIDPATAIIVQNRAWGDLGDWLSPEYDLTDKSLLWECYFIYDLEIMKEVALILGYGDDVERWTELCARRRDFFINTYIDPATGITVWSAFDPSRQGKPVDTQVSYALPIAMGIVNTPAMAANLVNTIMRENRADNATLCPPYSLMTGFIGTAWIQKALATIGRDDLAYRLLTSTSYPSWLYPVTQGATTVWERLDSYTHTRGFGANNSMNSFNHYSFGSVGQWLMTKSLGIDYQRGKLTITPTPDPTGHISRAAGWLDTPLGRVSSEWRVDGETVTYNITIPDGAEASLMLPTDGEVVKISSGSHSFTSSLQSSQSSS